MTDEITGPQLSLLRKTLGLGMSSQSPSRNWLPQIEVTDHITELAVLLEKGLMEAVQAVPIFYKATPAGLSLAISRQIYGKDVARGR